MLNQIIYLACIFVASIVLISFFIPLLVITARKNKLYDKPSVRKIHKHNIPRIGGLSFSPVLLVVICLSLGAALYFNTSIVSLSRSAEIKALCFIAGLMIIYMMGFIDDILGMSYRRKFVVQILAAIFIVVPGNVITNFQGILFIYEIPYWLGLIITIVGIVLVINAYNLSDGIDGLCAGHGITFSLIYSALCLNIESITLETLIVTAIVGILSTFFYFNVIAKRYKTFMGDTGSYTVGFICAYLFLLVNNRTSTAEVNYLLVGLSILFVPVFDTLRVFCVRIMHKHSPFKPDKNHMHHKLIALGLKHIEAVVVILAIQVFVVVINKILFENTHLNINIILILDVTGLITFNLFLNYAARINERKADKEISKNTISK